MIPQGRTKALQEKADARRYRQIHEIAYALSLLPYLSKDVREYLVNMFDDEPNMVRWVNVPEDIRQALSNHRLIDCYNDDGLLMAVLSSAAYPLIPWFRDGVTPADLERAWFSYSGDAEPHDPRAKPQIEQSLTNYLNGYFRDDPTHRKEVLEFPDWPQMARLELDRRSARLLEVMPDDVLNAIARGEVDLAELAGKIPA
jgi:hypothetical protein